MKNYKSEGSRPPNLKTLYSYISKMTSITLDSCDNICHVIDYLYTIFSEDDVRQILKHAEDFELEVIPLVQTFGHLEVLIMLVVCNIAIICLFIHVLVVSS